MNIDRYSFGYRGVAGYSDDAQVIVDGAMGEGGGQVPRSVLDILRTRPISLRELALLLDSNPRDLEDDLQHLFRSLRREPLSPVILPADCRKCGFRFYDHKLHKPSKCPRCKGTWISEPLISLEPRR